MARRPHAPTALEVLRVLTEHALCVGLLFAGLVAGAFSRDLRLQSPFDLEAWSHLIAQLGPFVEGLNRFRPDLGGYLAWNILAATVLQFSMYLHGLYDRQGIRRSRNVLLRLLRSAGLAGVVLAVVFFVVRPPELGRTALVFGYGLSVVAFWLTDAARRRISASRAERVLVLGTGPAAREAARAAAAAPPPGITLVGGSPLADWSDLSSVMERERVDRLLLASPPPADSDLALLTAARVAGVPVDSASEFAESLTGQVLEDGLGPEFMINSTSRTYGRISRITDVCLAGTLMVALSLPLALAALLLRITSGPPVLFRQQRVGRGGEVFTVVKLRTMLRDAEKDGPAWSPVGDPRLTAVGRWLRRWRVDELPQLVNVLRGDMAFVGPRPEQPFFVQRLAQTVPHYGLRHLVRPGLTGWAQVRHPYGATDDEARAKLRFDLFYIKHRSPWLDLAIVFDTIRVVLRGQGR